MKRTFSSVLSVLILALLCVRVAAQVGTNPRSATAYHPNAPTDPASLMSQENFANSANRGYAVVEGYIDYVAGAISTDGKTTRVKTEADGDFHFEMQSANKLRPPGESPDGLVCEIDPAWKLSKASVLSQVSRKTPSTYRKVRVYGWLRFGTESGHSGSKIYRLANGNTLQGHWEIHPVERVEAVDGGGPFDIGPAAMISSWPIAQRYKVTNANFASPGPSNYAKLSGTVQTITKSKDGSGDVDVLVKVGTRNYLATIPVYYVAAFDTNTQALTLVQSRNFSAIHYTLRPGTSKRTFYGLRNWRFGDTGAFAALQPVEMIK
jgi:hypothetical protein